MTSTAFERQGGALMGPRCDRCRNSEADCARNYPCCEFCTHFAEPEQPQDLTPDRPPSRRQEPTMTLPTSIGRSRDTISELLARARPVTDKTIARAVQRVDDAHNALRAAMSDHEGKAAARREVERLEKQLAEAKAKLRGGARQAAAQPATRSSASHPCSMVGCDRTFDSGQGRALHERRAHGHAA